MCVFDDLPFRWLLWKWKQEIHHWRMGMGMVPCLGCTKVWNLLSLGPVGKRDRAFHSVNHAFGVQSRFSTKKQKNKKIYIYIF